jgi:hypothetical protein
VTNPQAVYPINAAAANKDATKCLFMVEALLKAGADVNAKQQKDVTALHEVELYNNDGNNYGSPSKTNFTSSSN